LLDAPDFRDVFAIRFDRDVAHAGQLFRLLSVLAPALAVALAGDCAVRTTRTADAARREHEIDRGEAVLHAVRVMLDAARVHEKARLRFAPQLGGGANRFLGDARRLRRAL